MCLLINSAVAILDYVKNNPNLLSLDTDWTF